MNEPQQEPSIELLPCPVCQQQPEPKSTHKGLEAVCRTGGCLLNGIWFAIVRWNTQRFPASTPAPTGEAGEIPTPLCDAAYAAHPVLDTQTHRDAILLAEARLIEQEQARTIATLRDECARLREDAKLVDWLEAQNIVSLSKNAISGRWTIESVQFDHDKETHDGPLRSALAASRGTEGK